MSEHLQVILYDSSFKKEWDLFVSSAKNATFLFKRDYMDYHADRFVDHSLVVRDDKKIIAILPANIVDDKLYSHGGLTYGGFITDHTMRAQKMLEVFAETLRFLKEKGVREIVYKALPHIYHERPAEEDLYALFRHEFNLLKREPSSSIDMSTTLLVGKKMNGYRKALAEGLTILETHDATALIDLINQNLSAKYQVKAVHSADEMNRLHQSFKKEIRLYEVRFQNQLVGGAIIYLSKQVVHAQYLTATLEGRKMRCQDFMVCSLVEQFKSSHRWFDFGISTEQAGRYLNENLMSQKEEFGASVVCYDTYMMRI